MKRTALEHLEKWYKSHRRKPLIIRGARQVGKSTLVRLFCERMGFKLIAVNLERQKLKEIENRENFQIQRLLNEIEVLTNLEIAENSLIFLDEIQGQLAALDVLRYFYEQRPELVVIAAGSLLEVVLRKEKFQMPVGRVQYYHLGPMTYFEFLEATDNLILRNKLAIAYRENKISEVLHKEAHELLKIYYLVGGMPEAVEEYRNSRKFSDVREVHHELIYTYRDDIAKYSTDAEEIRVNEVFEYTNAHLGQTVVFKNISKAHSNSVRKGIQLLSDAHVIHSVYHNSCSGLPLTAGKKERPLKLYFCDIGMHCTLQGLHEKNLLYDASTELMIKGSLSEQFIIQHLAFRRPTSSSKEVFYWVRDGKTTSAEVDFVVSEEGLILPIEIKSGKTGKLKSLWQFMAEKKLYKGLRFQLNFENEFLQSINQKVKTRTGIEEIEAELIDIPLYLVETMSDFCQKATV